MATTEVGKLVEAAADGDQGAWTELVRRFTGLLWSITRSFGLARADAADVVQTCWLRLTENLLRLHDPDRVGSWLATTARRECLALVQRRARQAPAGGDDAVAELADPAATSLDARLLQDERSRQVVAAFARLGRACQQLLRVLMADPPPPYVEVAAALGMPIGSIGPTRGRGLEHLRRLLGDGGITGGR